MIQRVLVFLYGVMAYALFFGVFVYALGFIGNFVVPKSIDSAPQVSFLQALLVNTLLLGVFAVQHSVMARPVFKRWLTRFIPHAAERSTYVLISSLLMIALFVFWEPMGGAIWHVENPIGRAALNALLISGWGIVFVATLLINHFDLFGLRQVWLHLRSREYTRLTFGTPLFYRWVRHPLYVGWLVFFWATPTMTAAHLVFAVLTTAYILIAIQLEERDLVTEHGSNYENYRKRVPMLIPWTKRRAPGITESLSKMA